LGSLNETGVGWLSSICLHILLVLILLWPLSNRQNARIIVAPSIFAELVTATSFEQNRKNADTKTITSQNRFHYQTSITRKKTLKTIKTSRRKLSTYREKSSEIEKPFAKIYRSTPTKLVPSNQKNLKLNSYKDTIKKKPTSKKLPFAGYIERKRKSKNNALPNQMGKASSFTAPRLSQKFNNRPPAYPRLARQNGIEGRVVLIAYINKNGVVNSSKIDISSGAKLLDQAAKKAVSRWRFIPAKISDVAVSGKIRVPITFKLQKK